MCGQLPLTCLLMTRGPYLALGHRSGFLIQSEVNMKVAYWPIMLSLWMRGLCMALL